jgi:hypothetical protein
LVGVLVAAIGVLVGMLVGVLVAVLVGLDVLVGVLVAVLVGLGVLVDVFVAVLVGLGVLVGVDVLACVPYPALNVWFPAETLISASCRPEMVNVEKLCGLPSTSTDVKLRPSNVNGSSTLNVLLAFAALMLKLSCPVTLSQLIFWKFASWRILVNASHSSAFQIGTPCWLA